MTPKANLTIWLLPSSFFLGPWSFILTSAPSHYATLSDTLKVDSDSSALEFEQYFGPMNLRMAHNDIINILLSIFSKFAHTKEFVHAEIIRKHDKFPTTDTWDSIRTAYNASTDFVCDVTMNFLRSLVLLMVTTGPGSTRDLD